MIWDQAYLLFLIKRRIFFLKQSISVISLVCLWLMFKPWHVHYLWSSTCLALQLDGSCSAWHVIQKKTTHQLLKMKHILIAGHLTSIACLAGAALCRLIFFLCSSLRDDKFHEGGHPIYSRQHSLAGVLRRQAHLSCLINRFGIEPSLQI